MVTQDGHLFHESIRENLLFAAPEASEDELWAALRGRPSRGPRAVAAGRPRHGGRGARLPAVGRRAPAADDRQAVARRATRGDPRRGDLEPRLDVGGRRPGGPDDGARGAHGTGDRPPAVDDHRRRPDPRRRGRRASSERGSHDELLAARRSLRRAVPHPVPLRRRGPRARHDLRARLRARPRF